MFLPSGLSLILALLVLLIFTLGFPVVLVFPLVPGHSGDLRLILVRESRQSLVQAGLHRRGDRRHRDLF